MITTQSLQAFTLLAADDGLPATVGSWSLITVMAGILGWFLRRWSKQRDDAFQAAKDTEDRVSARYEIELQRERDARTTSEAASAARFQREREERKAVEAVLIADQARLRIALSRVVTALDGELTRESRNRLRQDVLEVLFDGGSPAPGDPEPGTAPQG